MHNSSHIQHLLQRIHSDFESEKYINIQKQLLSDGKKISKKEMRDDRVVESTKQRN